MNSRRTEDRSGSGHGRPPHRVRIPGFVKEEEVGLGDVVKRATSLAGIKPCGGCNERARQLNNWVVFTRRR